MAGGVKGVDVSAGEGGDRMVTERGDDVAAQDVLVVARGPGLELGADMFGEPALGQRGDGHRAGRGRLPASDAGDDRIAARTHVGDQRLRLAAGGGDGLVRMEADGEPALLSGDGSLRDEDALSGRGDANAEAPLRVIEDDAVLAVARERSDVGLGQAGGHGISSRVTGTRFLPISPNPGKSSTNETHIKPKKIKVAQTSQIRLADLHQNNILAAQLGA